MSEKSQKTFFKVSLGIAALTATIAFSLIDFNSKQTQAFLLQNVQDIAAPHRVMPADLSIEEVTYQKIDQKNIGHFETYRVIVRVRNRGAKIINRSVVLSVEGREIPVTNTSNNTFSLRENQEHLLNSFEIKFDKRLNIQKIPVTLNLVDQQDFNTNNNTYDLYINQFPALLSNASLTYNQDKQLTVTFDQQIDLKDYSLQIVTIPSDKIGDQSAQYRELNLDHTILQYGVVPATSENSPIRIPLEQATLTTDNDIFIPQSYLDRTVKYLQIRAIHPETQNYLVSDIIKLPITEEEPLNNAQFAKLLIEEAGIPLYRGQTLLGDLPTGQWYTPYIETLHNLGLITSTLDANHSFTPETIISRGDALKIILDYFDINLVVGNFANTFIDVSENNKYFFYVETLRADANVKFINQRFNTNHPATRSFVSHLINLYRTP